MSVYEALWGSEVLSDVEVVLQEDAEELGTKRRQQVAISSHKVVLACNSEYFKAQVSYGQLFDGSASKDRDPISVVQ